MHVLREFDAAHHGHRHVAQHGGYIVFTATKNGDRLFAVLSLDNAKTRALESAPQHATNDGLVVHYEHQLLDAAGHHVSLRGRSSRDKAAVCEMFALR